MNKAWSARGLPALLIIPAVALALVGCSHDADDKGGQAKSKAADKSRQKVIEIRDQPGSVKGYKGALKDAKVSRCKHAQDGLEVAGTVRNSASTTQQYRIYVSAVDGSDTKGIVQVDVADVKEGKSKKWNTELDLSGKGLKCVLRVERFAPKG